MKKTGVGQGKGQALKVGKCFQNVTAMPFLAAMVFSVLGLGGEAHSAEFYITESGCVNDGVLEIAADQLDLDLELCISNTGGYTGFLNYAWIIEVTDDIDIIDWVPQDGSPSNVSSPPYEAIMGTIGVSNNPAGPSWVGTFTVDIGPGGGEIWAGSNEQLVTESPGGFAAVVPSTLVPEPSATLLQTAMLLSLSAVSLLRRSRKVMN